MIYNNRLTELCNDCPYKEKRKVFGQGVITGKYVMIGECPGATEEEKGIPFVGKAGQSLRKALKEIGILDKCWFTNYVLCRPSNNNFKDEGMKKATRLCKIGLLSELTFLYNRGFTHAFLMGNNSCSAFGLKGISSIKGNLYTGLNNLKIIPNYHPSYIIRNGGRGNAQMWEEWKNIFVKGIEY